MNLYYNSRNKDEALPSSKAIIKGIAPNNGLYTPKLNEIEKIDLNKLIDLNYQQVATTIIQHFFDDFSNQEIDEAVKNAYDNKFSCQQIVNLSKYQGQYVLELYHGQTCAFKDMALSLLPHLLKKAYQKNKNHGLIYILTATSGDTGKAALESFKDVDNTFISVFYPKDNVSKIQSLQMLTTKGKNTNVIQVEGNFDDCQRIVKDCLACDELITSPNVQFSSANSINLGRLIPQVVYYFYSYMQLVKEGTINLGDQVNFCVPCGNFGNILAGFIAKQAGLPIAKLICASNSNNVLTQFIKTGIYDRNRPFIHTISPSMDILISSNIERLLFMLSDGNDNLVNHYMNQLNAKGSYEVDTIIKEKIFDNFVAYSFDDEKTLETIKEVYQSDQHVLDTHSAIAFRACKTFEAEHINSFPCISLATASPYKFAKTIYNALSQDRDEDEFSCMERLAQINDEKIPEALKNIDKKPILHFDIINKNQGIEYILNKLKEISTHEN